jgi:hypothetical protein
MNVPEFVEFAERDDQFIRILEEEIPEGFVLFSHLLGEFHGPSMKACVAVRFIRHLIDDGT